MEVMEQYPKTIFEFKKQFLDEEACRKYLGQIRWPDGFICPRCNYRKFWMTNRGQFRCGQCDSQISVTAGTIFQDSRIPLQVWFEAIWHLVSQKHGANAKGLQRVLGLSRYETTWKMLHRLRIAMVRPGRDQLIGPVQVDETYIGGPPPASEAVELPIKRLCLLRLRIETSSWEESACIRSKTLRETV